MKLKVHTVLGKVFPCTTNLPDCDPRKKLEPQNDQTPSSRVDSVEEIRTVQAPETDTTSLNQVEVPPWVESYEISATEMDGGPTFVSCKSSIDSFQKINN